jgi:aminoglycoside phosphotransferase family enzyme
MSWVFLTDAHAYKLKKPIRTALLDHTTIEARRLACDTELQLNRRLAPDVYLAVVPLTASGSEMRVAGEGTRIDWLVKMRRLPHQRMLDVCIARHTVQRADIDRLAAMFVNFYRHAECVAWDGPTYRNRIATDIESKGASLEQPHYRLPHTDIRAVVIRQERWLARHGDLLEARAPAVVDAHGDLRPEHICLEPQPVVIDCLEFNRDLRLLDPYSELSFLALECRRLGAAWIGAQLLAGYAERTGDRAPARLIRFYQSYHALVRAAVAIWHLDNGDVPQQRTDHWRERSARYLRIAEQLL